MNLIAPAKHLIISLLKIASPLWLPFFSAIVAGYVQRILGPLSRIETSWLFYTFVALPVIFSFVWGNITITKLPKLRNIDKILTCICYSFIAIFVLFFAGWGALMHLHI